MAYTAQTKKGKYSVRLSNTKVRGSHESFRTSEEFFRQLVDSLEDYAVFTTDKQGNVSSWNSGAERLLGYSEKEIIGRNAAIFFTPEARKQKRPEQELATALKKGRTLNERWHVRADKTRFWGSGLVFPLKDEAGKVRGFTKIMRDLTVQRHAEETLAKANMLANDERKRLYEVFMQAPALMTVLRGPEHIVELINPLARQVLGYKRKIEGRPLREALPELKGQVFLGLLDKVYSSGEPIVMNEVPGKFDVNQDGNLQEVSLNFVYQPYKDAKGKVQGIMAHAVDVTDQVKTRFRVEEGEGRLKTALEAGKMGAWQLDLLNDTATRSLEHDQIFGYKTLLPAWGAKIFMRHVVPHHREMVDQSFKHAFKTGELQFECEITRADKKSAWIHAKGQVFYDKKKNPIRMAGIVMDVTERQRLEKQKDEFLGIASHELKTPVTSIKAYTQVMQNRFQKANDTQSADLVGKMDGQLDKLSSLVADLLDVTKIESGKLQFRKGRFNFNDLVNEIVEEMQRTTDDHEIIKDLAKSRSVYGDHERIGQVITNLLSNAIKYSPHTKKILVNSATNRGSITLSIRDFGTGIPKRQQDKIFERFHRVDREGKETYPGLGLGLYISSEIIQRHQGRIWVESRAGRGSTFSFALPLEYKSATKQPSNRRIRKQKAAEAFAMETVKHE